jgi:predicted nucleic acid-binding protein
MVLHEVVAGGGDAARLKFAPWVETVTLPDSALLDRPRLEVDPGEAEAVALAAARQTLLLIDDRKGRRAASELGLSYTGTVGLLIDAKLAGLLLAVRPELEDLVASGVYLSAGLIERACRIAGETS